MTSSRASGPSLTRILNRTTAVVLALGMVVLTPATVTSAAGGGSNPAQVRGEAVTHSTVVSYFAQGSAALTSAQKKKLRVEVARIKRSRVPATAQALQVTGRADKTCGNSGRMIIARGDLVCNWRALARARATQVARYVRTLDFNGKITKRTQGVAGTKAARSTKSLFSYSVKTLSITIINSTGDNPSFASSVSAVWTCPMGSCTASLDAPVAPDYQSTELGAVVSAPLTATEANVTLTVPTLPVDPVRSTYSVQTSGATCSPEFSSPSATLAVFSCAVNADGEVLRVVPTVV